MFLEGKTFELLETGGPAGDRVVGFMRFLGAEPVYLPYAFRRALDRREGWMGLETFRAWRGGTLAQLKVRCVND